MPRISNFLLIVINYVNQVKLLYCSVSVGHRAVLH